MFIFPSTAPATILLAATVVVADTMWFWARILPTMVAQLDANAEAKEAREAAPALLNRSGNLVAPLQAAA